MHVERRVRAMPARRPLAPSGLVLLVGVLCAWFSWKKDAAFTVIGASPLGFPPPAQSPRAEIPRASVQGTLGGSKAADGPDGAEVMFTREEYLKRKDNGYKFPVGEEAYQFPPPIPPINGGVKVHPHTYKAHCDRVYKKKFQVCQRLKENRRRRSDCEYDAFRWRRTCYWKARGGQLRIHPNFRSKKHA